MKKEKRDRASILTGHDGAGYGKGWMGMSELNHVRNVHARQNQSNRLLIPARYI